MHRPNVRGSAAPPLLIAGLNFLRPPRSPIPPLPQQTALCHEQSCCPAAARRKLPYYRRLPPPSPGAAAGSLLVLTLLHCFVVFLALFRCFVPVLTLLRCCVLVLLPSSPKALLLLPKPLEEPKEKEDPSSPNSSRPVLLLPMVEPPKLDEKEEL